MSVFDAIQFYNELDILEIRLETLDPLVDYFIIAEASVTHSGIPKPFYLEENKERFQKFWDKIIYYKINDLPGTCKEIENNQTEDELLKICNRRILSGDWWPHEGFPAYVRDTAQKEFILRATGSCKPDDILILSDADEIPNPDTLKGILDNFDPGQVYNLRQKNYIFYMNLRNGEPWVGNFILTYNKFKNEVGFGELKMRRRGATVENGGWHFSFMGGYDDVYKKLKAYGEQSLNVPGITDNIKTVVDKCIENGMDLYGRCYGIWEESVSYETHPKYLVENQEKFKRFIR